MRSFLHTLQPRAGGEREHVVRALAEVKIHAVEITPVIGDGCRFEHVCRLSGYFLQSFECRKLPSFREFRSGFAAIQVGGDGDHDRCLPGRRDLDSAGRIVHFAFGEYPRTHTEAGGVVSGARPVQDDVTIRYDPTLKRNLQSEGLIGGHRYHEHVVGCGGENLLDQP